MTDVQRAYRWKSNAELIVAAAGLGYLRLDDRMLDPTYGHGTFWKLWRPRLLHASDIDEAKSPAGRSIDFTRLPWPNECFTAVVFDPPYKLNGTPTPAVDERYGVHKPSTWQARHALIHAGIDECLRVLEHGGRFLLKCQDQVCSGAVRWQTLEFTNHAIAAGCTLVDRFDMLGGRAQPAGRRQEHARSNYSTMLVLQKDAP